MSADSSRSVEPFRGVDCRPERQGRERANARGAHHQPADWFVPDNVEGPFCQLGELAPSLRSVLFGIAPIAAFACRDSMQIAGKPADLNPSCIQAVSEQASRPMRSKHSSKPDSTAKRASG